MNKIKKIVAIISIFLFFLGAISLINPSYTLGSSFHNIQVTSGSGSSGTVTSVGTAGLISGGPITTTGTITTSINTNKLVGRGTAGTGVMEEIGLGTGLSISGTTLNVSGFMSNVLTNTHIFVGSATSTANDVAFTLSATPGTFSLANTGALTMPDATTAIRGLLNATDWTTFNNKLTATLASAKIFVGSSGNAATAQNLSLNGTAGAFALGNTGILTMPDAATATRGLLNSTDWNTFNSKESPLTFSTGLTRTTNTITSNLSTGVAGGQTAIGGTAASNDLSLSSTSNSTKGKILLGTTASTRGAYDENKNYLGIGNSSPAYAADITGKATTFSAAIFSGSGLNDALSGGPYQGNVSSVYVVTIDSTGAPDTFSYSRDGFIMQSGVAIDGSPQLLDNNITIKFTATTGHTASDSWTITTTNSDEVNTKSYRIQGEKTGSITLTTGDSDSNKTITYYLPARLASSNQVLKDRNGDGTLSWGNIDTSELTGLPLPVAYGGTGASDFLTAGLIGKTDSVTAQGQVSDISDTPFVITGAGLYRVSYYLFDVASDFTAGAIRLNIKYTDDVANQTLQSAIVPLTTLGSLTQGQFILESASGNVSYGVTHTGVFGTAAYSLFTTIERLN